MENPGVNSPGNEQVPESSVEKSGEQYIQEVNTDFAQGEANTTNTPLRSAIEISNAGEGQIDQRYKAQEQEEAAKRQQLLSEAESQNKGANPQVSTPPQGQNFFQNEIDEIGRVRTENEAQQKPPEKDLHQEVLGGDAEANKEPSIEETLRGGKPVYNLKVQRSSGEMEDNWFATGISKDSEGVEEVRVWKESQDGTILRKNVTLEDLNQWNRENPSELDDSQKKSFKESPEGQPKDTEQSETPAVQNVFADTDQKLPQTQERLSKIESRIAEINSRLTEIQTSENLTREQLLEHMRLSQEFQGLISQKFDILLEQQRLDPEKNSTLYKDPLDKIEEKRQPEKPTVEETRAQYVREVMKGQNPRDRAYLKDEKGHFTSPNNENARLYVRDHHIEEARREMEADLAQRKANAATPEQRSAAIGRQLAELDAIKENRPLTDKEKIQYFDLLETKRAIDTQLQNVEKESIRKRNKKHTIIKVGAFIAGAGVGALTPPVSAAALIAIGLGGPILGRQGIKLSEKLRAKSNSLKYIDRRNKTVTELAQIDKKIKRNEWWANRLGEVSSALMGAGAGYGAGKAIQNIVNMLGTPSTPPVEQIPPSGGEIPAGQQGGLPEAPPTGEVTPPQGSIELPSTQPVSTTGSELASGDWLRTGELGWDTSKWGWKGPNLFVPQGGPLEGAIPDLQRKFLDLLSNSGVTKDMLYGQQAGEIFNQGLRNAVYTSGSNLQEVANATAQALKSLNP